MYIEHVFSPKLRLAMNASLPVFRPLLCDARPGGGGLHQKKRNLIPAHFNAVHKAPASQRPAIVVLHPLLCRHSLWDPPPRELLVYTSEYRGLFATAAAAVWGEQWVDDWLGWGCWLQPTFPYTIIGCVFRSVGRLESSPCSLPCHVQAPEWSPSTEALVLRALVAGHIMLIWNDKIVVYGGVCKEYTPTVCAPYIVQTRPPLVHPNLSF